MNWGMRQNRGIYFYCRLSPQLLLLICCLFPACLRAQVKPISPPARPNAISNFKVVEEHKDKDGNIIRTVRYDKGNEHITETQLIRISLNLHLPFNADTLNKDSVLIVVNKSHYIVEVWYRRRKIREYKAVFGAKPLEDKQMEGDRRTPEGWFTIRSKNPKSKYNKFLLLSYPNDSSVAHFMDLKAKGALPRSARIGGSVGIHGIWPKGDDMLEKGVCWTDGCVAIKNEDVDELYTFTDVGTRVFIKK